LTSPTTQHAEHYHHHTADRHPIDDNTAMQVDPGMDS
jgi:hypothetical protein